MNKPKPLFWLMPATIVALAASIWYAWREIVWGDVYYNFIYLLFDYRYGLARRSLEGALLCWATPPPYSFDEFVVIANLRLAVCIGLFLLIAGIALRRHPSVGTAIFLLAAATSPLTFKNQFCDLGRQDIYGIILLEMIVLASLTGKSRWALVLWLATAIPLVLIHEGQLFLFLPAGALLVYLTWDEAGLPRRRLVIGSMLGVMAAAGLINLLLPAPHIPYAEYHAYLQSKTTEPFSFDHDHWLYTSTAENFAFVVSEMRRLGPLHLALWLDYAGALASLGIIGWSLTFAPDARSGKGRTLMIAAMCILPGYVLMYKMTTDWARWTADLGWVFYLITLVLLFAQGGRFRPLPILLLVLIQFSLNAPFGVVIPELGLGFRVASRLGWSPSPTSTALAHNEAQRWGILLLTRDHKPQRAIPHFRDALAINPNPPDYNLLGLSYAYLHENDRAAAEFLHALELDPGFAPAHANLGVLLIQTPSSREQGIAELREALRIDPGCDVARRILPNFQEEVP